MDINDVLLFDSLLFISVLAGAQVPRESSLVAKGKLEAVPFTWVKVAPANEEFGIRMPELPKVGTETLVIDQHPVKLSYYGLIQNGTEYAVLSVSGLENKPADLPHMLMLDLYSRLIPTSQLDKSNKHEAAIKATYQRDILLNGYHGREYSLLAYKRTGVWRVYTVGKRFYAVAATTTLKDNILMSRFLNSFALGSTTSEIVNNAVLNVSSRRTPLAPSPSTGTWLIILKTFSKSQRSKANQKVSLLQSLGYNANVIDTNYYPNLKKGFLAVAMGPHSKSAAEGVLNKVRSVAPESYLKSGW
ncbi:MAG: hypothetical protein ABR568_00765 [Pyrinomonadaceae bacterium]